MVNTNRPFLYDVPWLFWSGLILYVLLIPSSQVPSFKFNLPIPADKLVHFFLFFVLLLLLGWSRIKKNSNVGFLELFFCLALVVFYGGVTEILQGFFTQSRTADVWDFTANTTGAVSAFVILILVRPRIK